MIISGRYSKFTLKKNCRINEMWATQKLAATRLLFAILCLSAIISPKEKSQINTTYSDQTRDVIRVPPSGWNERDPFSAAHWHKKDVKNGFPKQERGGPGEQAYFPVATYGHLPVIKNKNWGCFLMTVLRSPFSPSDLNTSHCTGFSAI